MESTTRKQFVRASVPVEGVSKEELRQRGVAKANFRFDNEVRKCYSFAKQARLIASDFSIMMNKGESF
ncbi:hypothetical protein FBQ85_14340 [Cytophagia bacterium CHB2]|nr:hypothetical protein [Cytophagia bacterium CHB2]